MGIGLSVSHQITLKSLWWRSKSRLDFITRPAGLGFETLGGFWWVGRSLIGVLRSRVCILCGRAAWWWRKQRPRVVFSSKCNLWHFWPSEDSLQAETEMTDEWLEECEDHVAHQRLQTQPSPFIDDDGLNQWPRPRRLSNLLCPISPMAWRS